MTFKNILYEEDNGIGIVTINRPQALNALNEEAYLELSQIFKEIEEDPSVRVVIITGSGDKSFVAGTDVTSMTSLSAVEARGFATSLKKTYDAIWNLNKPVIAAVNGFALGGGCELAMSADLIIASESAKFAQPEINLGIIPGSGGTQRLSRLVGISKAKEMVFTGRMIDAHTALDIGLVNKVVPSANLMNEARDMARKILSKSSAILALAKIAINNGANVDLDTALGIEIQCFSQCFATEDQKEGMNAFLAKRKPNFKNK